MDQLRFMVYLMINCAVFAVFAACCLFALLAFVIEVLLCKVRAGYCLFYCQLCVEYMSLMFDSEECNVRVSGAHIREKWSGTAVDQSADGNHVSGCCCSVASSTASYVVLQLSCEHMVVSIYKTQSKH